MGNSSKIPKQYQTSWDLTGNIAVDAVAAAISFYRTRLKAIKEVILHPKYYDIYLDYVEKQMKKAGHEFTGEEVIEFDSVVIKKGSRLMSERLYVYFYEQPISLGSSQEELRAIKN